MLDELFGIKRDERTVMYFFSQKKYFSYKIFFSKKKEEYQELLH